jgi:hypothetical protein
VARPTARRDRAGCRRSRPSRRCCRTPRAGGSAAANRPPPRRGCCRSHPARWGCRTRDLVLVRVARDPGDHVRELVQQRDRVRLEVDRARVARVEVAAGIQMVPERRAEQDAGESQLVRRIRHQALRSVVAEQQHQLVRRGRGLQPALQPVELRVVDVAVGGEVPGRGDQRPRLGNRVEHDEADPRRHAPGVPTGSPPRTWSRGTRRSPHCRLRGRSRTASPPRRGPRRWRPCPG